MNNYSPLLSLEKYSISLKACMAESYEVGAPGISKLLICRTPA